jgi:hypothetical protein
MVIDCDTCAVRGLACSDCVVSVLLGAPPTIELDGTQQAALNVLADAGMVPKLRLVPGGADRSGEAARARREQAS